MSITVREMTLSETELVIDYFFNSTREYLDMMGVDPTRFTPPEEWRKGFKHELPLLPEERRVFLVSWLTDDEFIGFSTCDTIKFGEQANMHLHVTNPHLRQKGIGSECVKRTVDVYFDRLKLKRLFCEPHAFNTAPNRALQKAWFKYLKTYMTVPQRFNYRQAVNRWVIER